MQAQDKPLRIVEPANGEVVSSGKPLIITVSAGPSVRIFGIIGENSLPNAQLVGKNQFQMIIPKTLRPGHYQLIALGGDPAPVSSEPVSIDVEREDPATGLQVEPPALVLLSPSDEMPITVNAHFADNSVLDVTRSSKTTFESRNPDVVTIDRAMAKGVGPGQSIIMIGYGSLRAAILVHGPNPTPTGPTPEIDSISPETGIPGETNIMILGRHFGENQGNGYVQVGTLNGNVKSWSDQKIVAMVPFGTHKGAVEVEQGGLYSNRLGFEPIAICIDRFSGKVIPGRQIQIEGSGFGSEQGSGVVTVADAKADIVNWSNTEITITVPSFVTRGNIYVLSVKQGSSTGMARVFAESGAW